MNLLCPYILDVKFSPKWKWSLIPPFFDISGCVLAHAYINKALEKLVEFLEKKRQAGDENQNNGLVLLCKNQDCLAALLNLLSPDLSLNTIKGFGLLDSVCQLDEIQVSILYLILILRLFKNWLLFIPNVFTLDIIYKGRFMSEKFMWLKKIFRINILSRKCLLLLWEEIQIFCSG